MPGQGLGTANLSPPFMGPDGLIAEKRECLSISSCSPDHALLQKKAGLGLRGGGGGEVGQSYATCPGHREVRFLKP